MNKFTKLSTAVGAAGLSLAFFATTAAFADTTSVTNTGNNVVVGAGASDSTSVSVNNVNTSVTTQASTTNTNTGGNTANGNIGGSSISSGNAGTSNSLTASGNNNATAVNGAGNASSDQASLVNTGNHVTFGGNGGNTTTVGVSNNNSAYATQVANSNVNTGENTSDDNIGGTSIHSGDAVVANNLGLQLNSNTTSLNGLGNGNSGDSSSLVNTGNNVDFGSGQGDSLTIGVSNFNNAVLSQMSQSNVNTGGNHASDNIGLNGSGAGITSGNAGVTNAFGVTANGNATGVNGAVLFNNSASDAVNVTNTGNHVTVDGGSGNSTSIGVTNLNSLVSTQMSSTNTNTGENTANDNIGWNGSNGIFSGNAALMAAMMANANGNFTGIGGATMPAGFWF